MIGTFIFTKLALASLIVLGAEVLRARGVRPQVSYAMWFAVVVMLLMPPILAVPFFKAGSIEEVSVVQIESQPVVGPNPATLDQAQALAPLLPFTPETSERRSAPVRPTPSAALPWLPLLVGVWVLGTLALLIRRARKLRALGKLVRAAELADPALGDQCDRIAKELGVSRRVQVVVANGAFSPFLWHPWLGKVRIVLPQALLQILSDDSIDAVLRHELVHVRRKDAMRHHVVDLTVALWWWYPLVWLSSKRLREFEELCADAEVIDRTPKVKRAYAAALLDAYEFLTDSFSKDLTGVPAFAKQKFLKARIEMIVGNKLSIGNRRLTACAAMALCLALIPLGSLTLGVAQTEEPIVIPEVPKKAPVESKPEVKKPEVKKREKPEKVLGSGEIVSAQMKLQSAVVVRVETDAKVTIRKGTEAFCKITTDDNIVPLVTVVVEDGVLRIGSSLPFEASKRVDVELQLPHLKSGHLDGSGEVHVSGFDEDKLTLEINGSGNFFADGSANHLNIHINGSGNFDVSRLESDVVNVVVNGAGGADVYAKESLGVVINGSGNISYTGSPKSISKTVKGSGHVAPASE